MRRSALLPLLGLALCAAPVAAQGPGAMQHVPGPMPGGLGPDPASMLLAATGRLKLTDAQVVRLAAIARRAEERRAAMRTNVAPPQPGADRRPSDAEMQRMHQQMEQMHEQARGDLRDALAVLTPDQQAMAFEMAAHHGGPGGPGGGHGPGGPGMRMRHPDGPPPPPRPDAR